MTAPVASALAAAPVQQADQTSAKSVTHKAHHRHANRQKPASKPAQRASLRKPSELPLPPAVGDAPVPNQDVQPPREAQSTDPNIAPSIFSLHYPSSGDGYIAGSSPQTIDNEHAARIGGAQITVPLK